MTTIPAPTDAAPLPMTVEELTPEWLTLALRSTAPGVHVETAETTRIIWGTATKVFLTLTYGGDPGDLPTRICAKGGFDERVREFGLGPQYELEAAFFRDLAPELRVPMPRSLFAGVDENRQGIVILEDLTERGVTFGDPLVPLAAASVSAALEVQAAWHGQTWGSKAGRFPWLNVGCSAVRGPLQVLLAPEQFVPLAARTEVPNLTGSLADPVTVRAAHERLWAIQDAGVQTLAHGDAHAGQTYIEPDGRVAFLDWQGVCLTSWAHDVAYFVAGAMSVEDRRSHERDLLTHYLGALRAAGGPELTFDDAWLAYRRHLLGGFVWQVTPTVMQPAEVVGAMATRYVAALEDHDTLGLLAADAGAQA